MIQDAQNSLCVLCFGDIVARPGREYMTKKLRTLREQYSADFVIANAENAAGGSGLDPKTASEILAAGVDIMTLGDHTYRRKEILPYLASNTSVCIRPANFPGDVPGCGFAIREVRGLRLGILNVLGRTFISGPLDCPFRAIDSILDHALKDCDFIICDVHAEATSEKISLARYLDGRAHLVFGTHTHVPTADLRILPKGTAAVSDLGMCGSQAGVIGMDAAVALKRFVSGLPSPYQAALGDPELQGVCIRWDAATKAVLHFERISVKDGEDATPHSPHA